MSLQFFQPADYFLAMRKIRSSRRIAGFRYASRALIASFLMLFGAGCGERDRLTFSTPSDGVGPVTTIDQPGGPDTTISPGSQFFVNGTTLDSNGVDTVYFLVIGANQGFPPIIPNLRIRVRFGIALTTLGHSGETWEVQIYGVDALGNQGNTSTRLIHVR